MSDTTHHRRIRSFVRREGRMTDGQKEAFDRLWPRMGIDRPDKELNLIDLFGRDARRIVEIGFGDGENLLHHISTNPAVDHLGIEVYRNGVGNLLRQAEQVGADNLRISSEDAVEVLGSWLPAESVDEVWLYFSDPWHKKRHHKRRLVQPAFCDQVAKILKPDGLFRLATDWENYAEHMQEVLGKHECYTPVDIPPTRVKTRFQRRGERRGHGVWDFAYQRIAV